MIERIRYIKSSLDGAKQGVIVLIYDQGYFGAGMSFCNSEEDNFDREVGKELARTRAKDSLEKKLYLRDLNKAVDPISICNLTGCNFPQGQRAQAKDGELLVKTFDIVDTFASTVVDMIYTLAVAKAREDSGN